MTRDKISRHLHSQEAEQVTSWFRRTQ